MKKVLLTVVAVLLVAGTVAYAATDTKVVTVNAAVSATAKLTLSALTVNFPDADPDLTPTITVAPITVTASGKCAKGNNVTLTVQAGGPLTSGTDTIAISNITWAVTGAGYAAGTMASASAVSLGSWLNSGSYVGTQTYSLANSWAYATGAYTTAVTYTLTAL
jgi:hypothetical protein